MNIKLPYGDQTIPIDVPDNWINGRSYRPNLIEPCADAHAELWAALSALEGDHSLSAIAKGKSTVVIAVDGLYLSSFNEILPALIEKIEDDTEIPSENIKILISNDLLSPLEAKDVEALLNPHTIQEYQVVLHDPRRSRSLTDLGRTPTSNIPVQINQHYASAELKIILGGVQAHPLFGFTGGRSVLMPGLAGVDALREFYCTTRITDVNSRYGNYRHNPFHIAGIETMTLAGCDLAISVPLTMEDQPAGVFAGHFGQSHLAAMEKLRESMVVNVKEPMDIVVTSGGGKAFDGTLIQLVDALSACVNVLKPEGTIVLSGELANGYGPAEFNEMMKRHANLKATMAWLEEATHFLPGQWYLHLLFDLLNRHEVILYNTSKSEDEIWRMGFTPTGDLNEAILGAMESHGQRCKIVALPDGPYGIAEMAAK